MKHITIILLCLLTFLPSSFAGKRVLFIGDSVTDGGWGRSGGSAKASSQRNHSDLNHIYGHSYMLFCASYYESEFPEAGLSFYNRGISGDDLQRLEARWKENVIDLHPDVLSILVGINDILYYIQEHTDKSFDFNLWEKRYRNLLDSARGDNPDLQLILGTPFIGEAGRAIRSEDFPLWSKMVSRLDTIVCGIAKDYDAVLLRYDELFAAQKKEHPLVPMKQWIWDGIHPTAAGHRLMADLWIKQCGHLMRTDNRKTIIVTTEELEKCPEGPYQAAVEE